MQNRRRQDLVGSVGAELRASRWARGTGPRLATGSRRPRARGRSRAWSRSRSRHRGPSRCSTCRVASSAAGSRGRPRSAASCAGRRCRRRGGHRASRHDPLPAAAVRARRRPPGSRSRSVDLRDRSRATCARCRTTRAKRRRSRGSGSSVPRGRGRRARGLTPYTNARPSDSAGRRQRTSSIPTTGRKPNGTQLTHARWVGSGRCNALREDADRERSDRREHDAAERVRLAAPDPPRGRGECGDAGRGARRTRP